MGRLRPTAASVRCCWCGQASPVSWENKALAASLAADHWHQVCWRQGTTAEPLCSRFAALRVRPAHHDWKRSQPWPEAWLIIEWPDGEAEPSKYWLSNLPPKSTRKRPVYLAKQRWLIERDYRELKQELGLGHYEGRGWPGLHHHAAMAVAAYGFLLTERMAIPPSAAHQRPVVEEPALSQCSRPRGAPGTDPAPSARLHRHDLSKDRHNPGTEDAAMSVLSAKNTETANSKRAFVTQVRLERKLHALVTGDEAEALVEPVGVGPGLVRRQLHEAAALLPGARDGVAKEQLADARIALLSGDADPLDLRPASCRTASGPEPR